MLDSPTEALYHSLHNIYTPTLLKVIITYKIYTKKHVMLKVFEQATETNEKSWSSLYRQNPKFLHTKFN